MPPGRLPGSSWSGARAGRPSPRRPALRRTARRNILEAARTLDRRVPDQLLVAAISEDPAYADGRPAVTTVTLHPERLAAEAVDLLLALVNGRRDVRLERLVPHDLLARESTRPFGSAASGGRARASTGPAAAGGSQAISGTCRWA